MKRFMIFEMAFRDVRRTGPKAGIFESGLGSNKILKMLTFKETSGSTASFKCAYIIYI